MSSPLGSNAACDVIWGEIAIADTDPWEEKVAGSNQSQTRSADGTCPSMANSSPGILMQPGLKELINTPEEVSFHSGAAAFPYRDPDTQLNHWTCLYPHPDLNLSRDLSGTFHPNMTSLSGAVPRMMRPAPGQNYPRTGFPLEGTDHIC